MRIHAHTHDAKHVKFWYGWLRAGLLVAALALVLGAGRPLQAGGGVPPAPVCPEAGPSPSLACDKEILLAIRDDLAPSNNWGLQRHWHADIPVAAFLGVTVSDVVPRVISIALYDIWFLAPLSGHIPSELGQLAQLEKLILGGNRLSGPIPPELGQLSRLTVLDLAHNQLSGPIPPELGQLAQLEKLILGGNGLSGPIPPELGQLTRLTGLDLAHNQLSGIPPELGQLTRLTGLDLAHNQLAGVPPNWVSSPNCDTGISPTTSWPASPLNWVSSPNCDAGISPTTS